ncbi:TRADD-N-associated membrane domain-containing protein [Streptomyces tibetensis]|uniref:TRADD-N-associated membrane domain-containing protein n=1 Tax=Streptomyces tibetensis TaxID=2382123 RepID=UPI0033DF2041
MFDDAFLADLARLRASGSDDSTSDPEPAGGNPGQIGAADQQPSPEDASLLTLSALWDTTHARLKLYHDVALGQANRSFRSAQWAMWLGFAALAGFVAIALLASTTAGSIVAGGLGAVAAGLAGFIGRTFVRSQESAAEHLRSYFDQPLELSRYLAAERLIADTRMSQDQRAEILTALVTAMVAAPQQPIDSQAQSPAIPTQQR